MGRQACSVDESEGLSEAVRAAEGPVGITSPWCKSQSAH
jgi:hypothetical protein